MWRWWLVTTIFESGGDCHHHFFKVEFAIFQAILGFTILQYQFFLILWARESYFSCYQKRSVLKICRKCDSGRGSAPDPAGGAHDAPADPLIGWGADTPPHTLPHSVPLVPRGISNFSISPVISKVFQHSILVITLWPAIISFVSTNSLDVPMQFPFFIFWV